MSCPKISASLSQHWRHSAQCDCLGSCWRAVSFNEDCKHEGKKGFWHGPVLRRAKPTQASALTHDSNLSMKSAGSGQCVAYGFGFTDATHHGRCFGSASENNAGDRGEDCGCLGEGDSSRPVGFCGHPWQELDGSLLNGVFWSSKETHTHTDAAREVWPDVWKCDLSSAGRIGALWVNDGTQPWGAFPRNHCRSSPPPNPCWHPGKPNSILLDLCILRGGSANVIGLEWFSCSPNYWLVVNYWYKFPAQTRNTNQRENKICRSGLIACKH